MTRPVRTLLVLLPVALAPCLTEAGITVWRDKNQNGPSQRVDSAVPDLRKMDFDDRISSFTADEAWLVCSEPRYRGECRLIDGTVDNLHGSGMNDRISSLRPAPQGRAQGWERRYGRLGVPTNAGNEPIYDSTYDPTARPAIRVYEHEDFRGVSQRLDRAVPNLGQIGLANQITSFRIERGEWQACTGANFGGDCTILRGDDDDLGNWSDRIVSLRPAGGTRAATGRPGGWGGYGDPRSGRGSHILLFTDSDFGGRSETFYQAVPDLSRYELADQVTSLRVEGGGTWEVCTEASYQGKCKTFRDSDQFLGSWSDTIVSLRPAPDEDR